MSREGEDRTQSAGSNGAAKDRVESGRGGGVRVARGYRVRVSGSGRFVGVTAGGRGKVLPCFTGGCVGMNAVYRGVCACGEPCVSDHLQ